MLQIESAIARHYKQPEFVMLHGIRVPVFQDVTILEYEAIAAANVIEKAKTLESDIKSHKVLATALIQSRVDPNFPDDGLDQRSLEVFVNGQGETLPITKRLIDALYKFLLDEFTASAMPLSPEDLEEVVEQPAKKRRRSPRSDGGSDTTTQENPAST